MNPTQGIFNQLLIRLGLPNVNWFGDPAWTKLAFVFLAQFGAGQVALIFLAGLKGIPVTLYEAAKLDGAGVWNRFRNITLPMMTPVILYDLILGLESGAAGLYAGLRHHPGRPGRRQPVLRPLPLRKRLSVREDGLRLGDGVDPLRHHLRPGDAGLPLVTAVGPLRGQ